MTEHSLVNSPQAHRVVFTEKSAERASGTRNEAPSLRESHAKGNGMFGVCIHNIKDKTGKKDKKGDNYFGEICKNEKGESVYFGQLYPTYDWIDNNGYDNFSDWVEKAAKKAENI